MVASQGGGDYENLPVGRYRAACYRIIDMGTHKRSNQDQEPKETVRCDCTGKCHTNCR